MTKAMRRRKSLSGLWFQRFMARKHGNKQQVRQQEAESSHLELQMLSRDNELEVAQGLNFSSPPPMMYFLQKGHTSLTSLNSAMPGCQLGGGPLSFKSPHLGLLKFCFFTQLCNHCHLIVSLGYI